MLLSWFLLLAASGKALGREAGECLLVVEAESGAIIFRRGVCGQRFSPASTFKVPLALMGFDSGILENERRPSWSYKPEFQGAPRERKTVDPTIWLNESIIWYSQEITRRLGPERLGGYLALFDYGNMDISGDPGRNNGLTHSWLSSSLQISSDEQAAFLGRFLNRRLGVSAPAYQLAETIIPRFETNGWVVRGKTGGGCLLDSSGRRNPNQPLGWFVGWAEKSGYQVIFVRLEIGDQAVETPASWKARDHLLAELPSIVGEP